MQNKANFDSKFLSKIVKINFDALLRHTFSSSSSSSSIHFYMNTISATKLNFLLNSKKNNLSLKIHAAKRFKRSHNITITVSVIRQSLVKFISFSF